MPRPFAVIGMTVFFTLAVLNDTDIRAANAAFWLFFAATAVSVLIKKVRKELVLPCAFAAGTVACLLLSLTYQYYYLPRLALSGTQADISVCITSEGEEKYGNCYYEGRIFEADGEETDIKVRLVFSSPLEAEAYDTVSGKFKLYTLGETSEKYLESYRTTGTYLGAVPSGEYSVTARSGRAPTGLLVIKLRSAIKEAILKALPNENGALAAALLLGDKSGLSDETLAAFSKIGITHIICVSGFHLSLWSMLILNILRKTGIPRGFACIGAMLGTVAFMFISGMTYSVQRSGIMTLLFLLGDLLMRKTDSLNSLGLSLTVIGIIDPFSMGSVSLRLSALATAGIILCSELVIPKFRDGLQRRVPKLFFNAAANIGESLLHTLAATAFTLPVSIRLYGTFNFVSLLANLLLTAAASPCMVLGAVGAAFGSRFDVFNPFAFSSGVFGAYMTGGSRLLASSDIAELSISDDKVCVLLFGLFSLCAVSVLFAFFGHSMPRLTAVLCAAVFVVCSVTYSFSEDTITRAVLVDAGNGICLMLTKGRENILIGAGGNDFDSANLLKNELSQMKGEFTAAFIPNNETSCAGNALNAFMTAIPERVYSDDLPDGCDLLLHDTQAYPFGQTYKSEKFTVTAYNTDSGYAAFIKTDDITLLVCFDAMADYSSLPSEARNADILIFRGDYPRSIGEYGFDTVGVSASNQRGIAIVNELKALGINAVATAGCGSIELRFQDGKTVLNRR